MSDDYKTHPHDEDDEAIRLAEEHAELIRIRKEAISQRDFLVSKEKDLKRQLEELEAVKAATTQQVNQLQKDMAVRNKFLEEVEVLRHRATHDDLTGVLNRGAILDVLKRELLRAEREGTFVGVLLADLDYFKRVNDTYGHLAGDTVLREAAKRIGDAVRTYDSVGRYGDDYFLIILSSCEDDVDMVKQAERIRSMVCSGPFETKDGNIPVTVSIGVAPSVNARDADAAIGAADAALYRAKRAGRNRVEVGWIDGAAS